MLPDNELLMYLRIPVSGLPKCKVHELKSEDFLPYYTTEKPVFFLRISNKPYKS